VNLIVPVNLQALRVAPNDASLVTSRAELFAGPTTAFEALPWRSPDYAEHWKKPYKNNVAAAVTPSLWDGVVEPLEAGVHVHWALPDGLTQGVQQDDGSLAFPAAPNRWLVTRLLDHARTVSGRQWIVESDRLMSEDEYLNSYYPASRSKSPATPVGWALAPGTDPRNGGAVYDQPWRRIGRVFALAGWKPATAGPGTPPAQALHLNELTAQLTPFEASRAPTPLRAVGPGGPAFAAYYPDSRGVFGFHDTFDDLGAGALDGVAFTASYVVTGWHGLAGDDPLQCAAFLAALAKATAANAAAPRSTQVTPPEVAAGAVKGLYRWAYDSRIGAPSRCLYGGQIAGLAWDTTGARPDGGDPKLPKCYLRPLPDDPTVRLAVGPSATSAVAALVKHEWGGVAPGPDDPGIPSDISDNLEFLVDALQLGLLQDLGPRLSLPQLEQALHQTGFGALRGGASWIVRAKGAAAEKTDPLRFEPPEAEVPDLGGAIGRPLATLNAAQARLDAVLGAIDTCRRQIFLDWNLYFSQWGASGDATTIETLKTYVSAQILDLWAKLDAAFGIRTPAAPTSANLPAFYADRSAYMAFDGARYQTSCPPVTLAGQIAAAANGLLDQLEGADYANFELVSVEGARFWRPNEPVVVATGDSLRPAQRNGVAKYLLCRLSSQLVGALDAKVGAAAATMTAAQAAAALKIGAPDPRGGAAPEAADLAPLLTDMAALQGEACLLDATLAPLLAPELGASPADLAAALAAAAAKIATTWEAGALDGERTSPPATLDDLAVSAGALALTLRGQAPQGLALTASPGAPWADPFLPLFLIWEVKYEAYQKGAAPGVQRYDAGFVTNHFVLDPDVIDLTLEGDAPPTQGGAASLRGFIPLSSRAAEPLLDQIRQYLDTTATPDPQLQAVVDDLRGKPLLSQGLSGLNAALLARAQGMQLAVFNPFYYSEPPAVALGAGNDTFNPANALTHFVAAAAGALADQTPLDAAGFNPLRAGTLEFVKATVVDVFGRRRTVIDASVAADANKVVVSAQFQPPRGSAAPIALPPRLAQATRLRFDWVSGVDGAVVSNSAPSTSPVAAWVVLNYLDDSLMLFAPSGEPLGALGAFGGQAAVAWQSAPGRPARAMTADLGDPDLAHLLKFATFLFGQPRQVFGALTTAIEDAHTYILPQGDEGQLPYAVLMGRPLALVRAQLRLETPGVPASDAALAAVLAVAKANAGRAYDPAQRDDAGLAGVRFPVRLGDRDNLADGLVGYLIDGAGDYKTFYAPAAPASGSSAVMAPGPETIALTLRPALEPPASPYADAAAQTAALRDASTRPPGLAVTMLIDPRASVTATTGILPITALDLAPEIHARALRSIQASFFTHPILRGAQALDLPAPVEPGFVWAWTMGVKVDGVAEPRNEPLVPSGSGDRAGFDFSPQEAQDGWLTLVPAPSKKAQP